MPTHGNEGHVSSCYLLDMEGDRRVVLLAGGAADSLDLRELVLHVRVHVGREDLGQPLPSAKHICGKSHFTILNP